jgi:hypothetical protein
LFRHFGAAAIATGLARAVAKTANAPAAAITAPLSIVISLMLSVGCYLQLTFSNGYAGKGSRRLRSGLTGGMLHCPRSRGPRRPPHARRAAIQPAHGENVDVIAGFIEEKGGLR